MVQSLDALKDVVEQGHCTQIEYDQLDILCRDAIDKYSWFVSPTQNLISI